MRQNDSRSLPRISRKNSLYVPDLAAVGQSKGMSLYKIQYYKAFAVVAPVSYWVRCSPA
jgi:hypothetical protein